MIKHLLIGLVVVTVVATGLLMWLNGTARQAHIGYCLAQKLEPVELNNRDLVCRDPRTGIVYR